MAVELGGVTRFISRADIRYVEAQGDYARLHTADGSHLLRTPLATLEEQWAPAGFVRIHRSLLVSLPHVDEVRTESGRCTVVVGGAELAGQPPPHPRPPRPAGPPQPPGCPMTPSWLRARSTGHLAADDVGRRGVRRPARPARSTSRARWARCTCARCCAPSCGSGWPCSSCSSPSWSAGCRWCSGCCPRSCDTRRARHAAGVGAARVRGLPDAGAARLVLRPAAERNERAFTDVVERRDDREPRLRRRRGRRGLAAHGRHRHLGAALQPDDVATSSWPPAPSGRRSTPAPSAASTSPPRRSSASPAWCWRSAPTCSGTPSAGPPATSCCSRWSPRRCAAVGRLHAARLRPGPARGRGRSASSRSALVVAIGWLYLIPQLKGAGFTLDLATGLDNRLGRPGRRRRRARQRGHRRHAQRDVRAGVPVLAEADRPARARRLPADGLVRRRRHARRPTRCSTSPARRAGPTRCRALGPHPLYTTYSIIIATFLGTMGLPHVVVRFYTNPDGRAARRTTLVVLGLLGVFYVLPPVYGALGRHVRRGPGRRRPRRLRGRRAADADDRRDGRRAAGRAAGRRRVRGVPVDLVGPDDRGRRRAVAGPDEPVARRHRVVPGGGVPRRLGVAYVLAVLAEDVGVATAVGLAFAVAASTFCPLLVLGIWWRRLTDVGAIAGLVVGGSTSGAAVLRTFVATEDAGWFSTLMAQPAAWTVPARLRRDGRRLAAHPGPPARPRHPLHGPPAHPGGRRRRPRLSRTARHRSSHRTDRWPNSRPRLATYAHAPLPRRVPARPA